jgi:hypothetical protein
VLSECHQAMTRTLDIAAQKLLRALFDLADADVRPSLDLLARLLGTDVNHAIALLAGLRRAGLIQTDRLGLTMAGLAIASSIAPIEPAPMAAPIAKPIRALRVA